MNVQSSKFSSANEVSCVINLALIPEPWWALQQVQMPNIKFVTPKASDGLWWDRLNPTAAPGEGEAWWHVTTAASGTKVAAEMIHQLETDGVPTLKRLLDRDALISTIRQGDLGFFKGENFRDRCDTALAVMLSDEGLSNELDGLLLKIASPVDARPGAPTTVTTADWIRQRASERI